MTTRNKKKLAALNKENCEEHPRSNLPQNSSAPRSQEDYITIVSEEIEGRVTKRLSKEFSRTENPILGALARLDDFLMNPLLPGHSGTTPEPSRNALNTSQGTNEEEDDSQNDPRPEAGLFHGQITQNSGPEDGHDSKMSEVSMFWKFGCMQVRILFVLSARLTREKLFKTDLCCKIPEELSVCLKLREIHVTDICNCDTCKLTAMKRA